MLLFAGVGFVIGMCVGIYAVGGKEPAAARRAAGSLLWSAALGVGAYAAASWPRSARRCDV
jgi:predicted anti-sigma-YlaC factor YlaD